MKASSPDFSTDYAWEEWGRRDPYFGVITDPKFRRSVINQDAKADLFLSGRMHVTNVMQSIARFISSDFRPQQILDFGCGVGRTLIPFARYAQLAVGLDVSRSMLLEAKRNCEEQHAANISLRLSDDALSSLDRQFDLIHSYIVFQHIPFRRGVKIFSRLIEHLASGGVGAIHFLYSSVRFTDSLGRAPLQSNEDKEQPSLSADRDPDMQMNPYSLTELLFILQSRGVTKLHVEFTNHGGELGVYLFFLKP